MDPVLISQDSEPVDLAWRQGDPISLAFYVAANWSGSYELQVRATPRDPDVLIELAVTAVWDAEAERTDFTLTASAADSRLVEAGEWSYDMQAVGGVTRIDGTVYVSADVTR